MSESACCDQRLPKQEIIRKRADFQELFQKSGFQNGEVLRFFFAEAESRQVAFSVSKKLGKAVTRNRIKRLMREVYRIHRHEIGSFRILMQAKRQAVKARIKDMETDLLTFIKLKGLKP